MKLRIPFLALISLGALQAQDAESPGPSRAIPVSDEVSVMPSNTPDADEAEQNADAPAASTAIDLSEIEIDEAEPEIQNLPAELRERLVEETASNQEEEAELSFHLFPPAEAPDDWLRSPLKVHNAFDPRPMQPAPVGWTFRRVPESAPDWHTELTLADGSTLGLKLRAFQLSVPQLGDGYFSIIEPGFQASESYRQSQTVGGILTRYDEELESTEKSLDLLIKELDLLISTLPAAP